MTFFESILMVKAYAMLSMAVIGGETLEVAGADYFEATCYIEGYEAEGCSNARQYGVVHGAFPMDLTDYEYDHE